MNKQMALVGTGFIALGIILGAFGAHGLKELVSPERLLSFETGVKYQIYHGLGILLLGLNADKFRADLKWVFTSLIGGTILFSVSIYFLALQDVWGVPLSFLGTVTPLGGLAMIIGWALLFYNLLRDQG